MCTQARVSRSGYYAYKKRRLTMGEREMRDQLDFIAIKAAYEYEGFEKGAKQIKMRLERDYLIIMNLKRIHRLMSKYDLICPIRKANPVKAILRAQHSNKVFSNILDRNFFRYRQEDLIDRHHVYHLRAWEASLRIHHQRRHDQEDLSLAALIDP